MSAAEPVILPGSESGENPLVEGLERTPVHPTSLVIFGATGDLAHRKLLPAVYNLAHEGQLPERFEVIGVGRRDQEHEDFRDTLIDSVGRYSRRRPDAAVLEELVKDSRYIQGSFDDDSIYEELGRTMREFDEQAGYALDRVFYLSTAPEFFPLIAGKLGAAGLNEVEGAETRIVIEKPFGYDLASARQLNAEVLEVFDESQIFRIDHYLGKETVQNLMAARFANVLFEPVWNRNYIDCVQITAAEEIGIGSRAGYYEHSGALRDLVQNHMLQLLALLAMEPPTAFTADRVRDEKLKVLEAIVPEPVAEVPTMAVRAQYGPGVVGGVRVPGYIEESGVAAESRTETYAALRLNISNWRWSGVPFYLRTGKRLARKLTEIAVILKPVPHVAFQSSGSVGVQANQIIFTLQPDEGVSVSIGAKIPGSRMRIRPVNMEFRYGTSFVSESPEAYERLILDAMRGDPLLFTRNDEIEALWGIIDPILESWRLDTSTPMARYESGSTGPAEADALLLPGAPLAAAVTEDTWSARDTTPEAVEAALREMLREQHAANATLAPARVLNLIVIVDREWKGEVANRLERVGRYHASRTVVCAVEAGRTTLDARATISHEDPHDGLSVVRETVELDIGPDHLIALTTLVDPVLVSEIPTVCWSPHGHTDVIKALLPVIDVIMLDSDAEGDPGVAFERAERVREDAYVVDLAWLRTTPWRERLAASFHLGARRAQLGHLLSVEIRHREGSTASALLLAGWLASRLGWERSPLSVGRSEIDMEGAQRRPGGQVAVTLRRSAQEAPGLAGVTVSSEHGNSLSLQRSLGGLDATEDLAGGARKAWKILGASRGEAGILGEGIRQALLREPTYGPSLHAARDMCPR